MAEINLGAQRLSVSRHLGEEFLHRVETGADTQRPAQLVREALTEDPDKQVIGYKFREGDGYDQFTASLTEQLGGARRFGALDIQARVTGSESHYIMAILGEQNLGWTDKLKVNLALAIIGVQVAK